MKTQNILLLLALGVAAVLLLKKPNSAPPQTAADGAGQAPVVHVIEETLHQHEGEDNPIVHAFEEALEQKAKHEA